MIKRIICNGVVVGEIEATGDYENDVIATRNFLKEKGLHKNVSTNDAMFRQANSFAEAAMNIYKKDFAQSPYNVLSAAPFVVNATFCIEIYLKTIYHAYGTEVRGHNLKKLYDGLPEEALTIFSQSSTDIRPQFRLEEITEISGCLSALISTFEKWRYLYESDKLLVEVQPMLYAMRVTYEACSKVRKLKNKT